MSVLTASTPVILVQTTNISHLDCCSNLVTCLSFALLTLPLTVFSQHSSQVIPSKKVRKIFHFPAQNSLVVPRNHMTNFLKCHLLNLFSFSHTPPYILLIPLICSIFFIPFIAI